MVSSQNLKILIEQTNKKKQGIKRIRKNARNMINERGIILHGKLEREVNEL